MNTERLTQLADRMAEDVGTPAAHGYNQLDLGACAISYIDKTRPLRQAVARMEVWQPHLTDQLATFFDIDLYTVGRLFGSGEGTHAIFGEAGLIAAITRIRREVAKVDAEHQTPLPAEVSADLAANQQAEDTFA